MISYESIQKMSEGKIADSFETSDLLELYAEYKKEKDYLEKLSLEKREQIRKLQE